MKKDKKWLINEIEIMGNEVSENYPYDQMVGIELVMKLIDQLDEPEKVTIPQFVADDIECLKGEVTLFDAITTMPMTIQNWAEFIVEEFGQGAELYARAWLDGYEVEKEQLYYVLSPEGKTILRKDGKGGLSTSAGYDLNGIRDFGLENFHQLTEKEIKGYDERYWPFAVEVAE